MSEKYTELEVMANLKSVFLVLQFKFLMNHVRIILVYNISKYFDVYKFCIGDSYNLG